MSAAPSPVVDVSHLTVEAYEGRGKTRITHRILSDVSIQLPAGGAVGIVGESGSGKSTLIRAILDLLPPAMTRTCGSFTIDGVAGWTGRERDTRSILGATIGYIPQDPLSALHPALPIFDQVTEVVRLHSGRRLRYLRECLRGYFWRVRSRGAAEQAAQLLSQVGVPDAEAKVRQFPHEFSGGMRQRVMIASALAGRPSVLLADEPTTALDASVERRILDLIGDIKTARGLSILLVSHDLNVVSWMCDYAYVLYRGHVVEEGRVEDLFRTPRHPYTRALVMATPGQSQDADDPATASSDSGVATADALATGCVYRHRCPRADALCAEGQPPLVRDEETRRGAVACVHPLDGGAT